MSRIGKQFASLVLFAFPFLCVHANSFDSNAEYDGLSTRPGFHAVERIGVTLGGDAISKLTRSDGSVREIGAGGLYQIGLGALYQFEAPFSAALTLNYHYNYHYNSDYNNNDNASFRRVPVEVLAYFNGLDPFRVGGGIRYIYSARATSNINGVTEKFTFKNTRGSIVEIGYQVRPSGWVSLRYVKEIYEVATYSTTAYAPGLSGNTPYNGHHVGLFIGYEY